MVNLSNLYQTAPHSLTHHPLLLLSPFTEGDWAFRVGELAVVAAGTEATWADLQCFLLAPPTFSRRRGVPDLESSRQWRPARGQSAPTCGARCGSWPRLLPVVGRF
jgi:hypothetical protein